MASMHSAIVTFESADDNKPDAIEAWQRFEASIANTDEKVIGGRRVDDTQWVFLLSGELSAFVDVLSRAQAQRIGYTVQFCEHPPIVVHGKVELTMP